MRPVYRLDPASDLDARLGHASGWTLIPLRIPTGWSVRWNGLEARRLATGEVEINDSQDLLWVTKLPPPREGYSSDRGSPWRELHLDAGWYGDRFRVVVLDPDWDHVSARFETADPAELVRRIEEWLIRPPDGGAA
jgi:hypothetical protein